MRKTKLVLLVLFTILLMSCGTTRSLCGCYADRDKSRVWGAVFTFNNDRTFDFDYRAMCFEHSWNHGTWTPVYKTDRNRKMVVSKRHPIRRQHKYDKILLNFARHDNIPLKIAEYYQSDMKYKMIILPEESFYNIPVWVIVNGEPVNVSNSEREEHVVRLSAAKFPKIESIAIKSDMRLNSSIWDDVKHHRIETEVYKVKNPDNNIYCISLPFENSIRSWFDLEEFKDSVIYVKRNAIVYSGQKLRKR